MKIFGSENSWFIDSTRTNFEKESTCWSFSPTFSPKISTKILRNKFHSFIRNEMRLFFNTDPMYQLDIIPDLLVTLQEVLLFCGMPHFIAFLLLFLFISSTSRLQTVVYSQSEINPNFGFRSPSSTREWERCSRCKKGINWFYCTFWWSSKQNSDIFLYLGCLSQCGKPYGVFWHLLKFPELKVRCWESNETFSNKLEVGNKICGIRLTNKTSLTTTEIDKWDYISFCM